MGVPASPQPWRDVFLSDDCVRHLAPYAGLEPAASGCGQGTHCPLRWCPFRPHAGKMGIKKHGANCIVLKMDKQKTTVCVYWFAECKWAL